MSIHSKASILTRNTSWIYVSKLVNQLLVLVATIYVIRLLPVEVYGTYNFILSVFIVLSIFVLSPVNSIINRYVPEFIQKKTFYKFKQLILIGLIASSIYLCVFLLLIYLFQKSFGNFFNIPNFPFYIIHFIVYAVFRYYKDLIVCILNALLLHKKTSVLNMIDSILRAVLYLSLLNLLDIKLLIEIETFLAFIYIIPSSIILWKYLKKLPKDKANLITDGYEKKRITKFWFYSSLSELGAGIVNKTSDFYIISAMSNQYYVGLYSFAYRLFNMINQAIPLKEILSVLRPLFIQKFSADKINKDEFNTIYNLIIKIMLPICMLPSLYFLSLGKPLIIYLFDPKYVEAYWVTNLAFLSFVFVAMFYPLGLTILLKERMDIALYSKIVVVFSILGGIIAMKYWGIIGVALVTLTGNILKNLTMLYLFRKVMAIEYRLKELLPLVFLSVIMISLFSLISNHVENSFHLILASFFFLFIYCLILILLHPFKKKDFVYLQKIADNSGPFKKLVPLIKKVEKLKYLLFIKNE